MNKICQIFVCFFTVTLFLLLPSLAHAQTVKIMSFNMLGEPLCRGADKHRDEIKAILDFGRQNNISVIGLQELRKQKVDDDNCPDWDHIQYLQEFAGNYNLSVSEYIHTKHDSGDDGDEEKWWYRAFAHDSPLIGPLIRRDIGTPYRGIEVMVVDTAVGPIRFINVHNGDSGIMGKLVPITQEYRAQDDIPMIVLGDFNIQYFGEGSNQPRSDPNMNDYRMFELENGGCASGQQCDPVKYPGNKGFYRACDPAPGKFPNGNCQHTVNTRDSGNVSIGIDHILIDTRTIGKFKVKNAYVDQTTFAFSDHFPVVVELEKPIVPNCSNLSGPGTLTVGTSGTYSATVMSPGKLGDLAGEIFRDQFYPDNQTRLHFERFLTTNTATIQAIWTPTAADVGTHTIHCRAWNDSFAECRPPGFPVNPPQYTCAGPNSSRMVTVVPNWYGMFREFYKANPNAVYKANTDAIINAIDYSIVRNKL